MPLGFRSANTGTLRPAEAGVSNATGLGGLVGYNDGGTISNSSFTGSIVGDVSVFASGLVGINDGLIEDSFFNGFAGGGAAEVAIAKTVREKARSIPGREQIVVQKFAEALEEIPLTIASNAGMNVIDTLAQLRSAHSNGRASSHGVDAIERKVKEMLPLVIEPAVVKEQVFKTAVEVTNLLVRVDDVLMAKPAMHTHTHDDGTKHTHAGGDKEHQHDHFDRLGRQQRPSHHYY